MVWEGEDAAAGGRRILGETKPSESTPGSIRGDYCISIARNICHGSDSPESAQHEIALWFGEGEVANWDSCEKDWVYDFGRK
jgi:nucleoside-diphosphate kinase